MTDTFQTHNQDDLRRAMIAAHQSDLTDMAMRGQLPPWQNEDIILQGDEERLLTAILDNNGLHLRMVASGTTCGGLFDDLPVYTETTTATLGMTANANARAVINRCLHAGWITQTYSEVDECYVLDTTALGVFMLDCQQEQKEWGDE